MEAGGPICKTLPSAVGEGDAVFAAVGFGAEFGFAGEEDFVVARGGSGGFEDLGETLGSLFVFAGVEEAFGVEGHEELADVDGLAAEADATEFVGHRAAAQDTAEHFDHDGEA